MTRSGDDDGGRRLWLTSSGGTLLAFRVTVEVDEDRLREAGIGPAPEDIMAELTAPAEGRLSLQSRDHWLPVRNMKVRPR
jgi:hypothetical protein